jgi:hypothetical protein
MSTSVFAAMGGALAALSFVIGLFFWQYWRTSGDRLFVFFAAAFWLMGTSWGSLVALSPASEGRPYLYLLRLAAFILIAVAIVDKNRRSR